jgi:flagellar basal-body rod modification protein FlgD
MSTTTAANIESIYAGLGLTRADDKEEGRSSNELAQEDFLKLMVTQLTHQDPFQPMENGDFLAQIAQFSSVSGLDKLNDSFSALSASMTSNQAMQAGALVNREVLVQRDYGLLPQGGLMNMAVDLPANAGDVVLTVKNGVGAVLKEINLGTQTKGRLEFSWDGSMDNGEYAPPGVYSISTEAVMDNENMTLPTLVTARVESVSLGTAEQGLTLNLDGLGPVAFDDIAQIH